MSRTWISRHSRTTRAKRRLPASGAGYEVRSSVDHSGGKLCVARTRIRSPSERNTAEKYPSHSRTARLAITSSTGWTSAGEPLMTRRISAVAACCSRLPASARPPSTFSPTATSARRVLLSSFCCSVRTSRWSRATRASASALVRGGADGCGRLLMRTRAGASDLVKSRPPTPSSASVTHRLFSDPAALEPVSPRGRPVASRADPVRAGGTSQTGASRRRGGACRIARTDSPLPGQLGRLVLVDALGDRHDGLDAVEAPRVLPEQLALDRDRHLVSRHELERLPAVLGVVMRVVRGPQPHVLVVIPHAVDRLLVTLEGDEAALVEHLVRITHLGPALEGVEIEEVAAPAEHEGQPGGVGLEHGRPQARELVEPSRHQHGGEPGHGLEDEAERLGSVDAGLHAEHDVAQKLAGGIDDRLVREEQTVAAPARAGDALAPLRGQGLPRGKGMHGEHHAEVFELSPERIELGQRGLAPVPEAGPDGGGLG